MSNFFDKLNTSIDKNDSLLCVGLDPALDRLPEQFKDSETPLYDFNKAIVDATASVVCAYKPNSAFYERHREAGLAQLEQTIRYIQETYPDIPVILDSKRGDIGNTNDGYVDASFDWMGADAVTLSPYMGKVSLEPFLVRKEKGIVLLCRTSNEGSDEFQCQQIDGTPLYQIVAKNICTFWNENANCLLVVGATQPQEMRAVREIVGPDMIILAPGVGAQGGDIEAVMKAGLGANRRGLIVNSSRVVIHASSGEDFATAALASAVKTRDSINEYR